MINNADVRTGMNSPASGTDNLYPGRLPTLTRTATPMNLNPFAAQVRFSADHLLPEHQWRDHLAKFLESIARRCEASGPSVIGHIKALALFDDHRYLRASVVSSRHPADLEGNPPGEFRQMEITLNVLVYGLDRSAIEALVADAISEIGQSFGGSIVLFTKNNDLPIDRPE